MEHGLRTLVRIPWMIHNWTSLSNYTPILQNVLLNYACYSQDSFTSKELTNSDKSRESFNDTHSLNDPATILKTKIASKNCVNLNAKSAFEVMMCLYEAMKEKRDSNSIKHSEEFVYLCQTINRDIKQLNINEIINMLKILTSLEISSETVIVQRLLQILRVSVNDLPIDKIPFIHFLLMRHKGTHLVNALLTALPLVFQNQLASKLDTDDVTLLTRMLAFSSSYCTENEVGIITDTLSNHCKYIDVNTAQSIHNVLFKLKSLSTSSLKILSNVQQVIQQGAKELSHKDILALLKQINYKVANQQTEFYSEYLMDSLNNAVLGLDLNFSEGVHIIGEFNKMNYGSILLLDYLAAKCYEDESALINCNYHEIKQFIKGFTIADYKPIFWDMIQTIILNNNIGKDYSSKDSILQFGIYLTALDCYHPEILKACFSINVMETGIDRRDTQMYNMLLLHQSIKTLYPQYTENCLPEAVFDKAQTLKPEYKTNSLKAALERALGGSQYVRSDLRTKLGHFIDHVVIVQPDGQPADINNDTKRCEEITYVEDVEAPPGSRTILIFNFPEEAYSINYRRLKSTWSLVLRSAEALTGFFTIGINSDLWAQLPEHERIPYIKQSIKLKCDDILFPQRNGCR